jgi:hypothetical protein
LLDKQGEAENEEKGQPQHHCASSTAVI